MNRLIQTLALGVALVTLVTCIWREYGALAALGKVVTAWVVTYFAGAFAVLATRLLTRAPRPAPVETATARPRLRRRRPGRATSPDAGETEGPAPTPAS